MLRVILVSDARLTRTQYIFFGFTIGATPGIIQLGAGFTEICYTATAVENEVVDGDVFYNMTIAFTGTTVSLALPAQLDSTQATIIVRDNERKLRL